MEPWGSSINRLLLLRIPIQNDLKPSIAENRRNKAKHPIWNFIRFGFTKNTKMLNLVEFLRYITCYSSSSLRPIKSVDTYYIYSGFTIHELQQENCFMGCKLLFASTKVFASSNFNNFNLEFVNYKFILRVVS